MESIFDILYIPMGFLIRLAYSLTNNYVAAICLFALVMEILLCPIAIKQQKNSVKQASLAPRIQAIRKKYAGRTDQVTQQKMQQETMDLYQSENFNPAGGCLPLLIQLPVIMCLYKVIVSPLRYICNVPQDQIESLLTYFSSQGVEFAASTQQVDMINHLREMGEAGRAALYTYAPALENAVLPVFQVGPFDMSQVPTISFAPFDWLMLIPVLTFIVSIVGQKITQKFTYQAPEAQDAQSQMSMKIMTWTMPLLSVYIEFQMAAAIGVYWIFRNIISVAERILLAKLMPVPKFTEADYKEAERQANLSGKQKKKENKQKVRSLHHIDDEEYLARHAEDDGEEGTRTRKEGKNALAEKKQAEDSPIDKAPLKEDKPDNKE